MQNFNCQNTRRSSSLFCYSLLVLSLTECRDCIVIMNIKDKCFKMTSKDRTFILSSITKLQNLSFHFSNYKNEISFDKNTDNHFLAYSSYFLFEKGLWNTDQLYRYPQLQQIPDSENAFQNGSFSCVNNSLSHVGGAKIQVLFYLEFCFITQAQFVQHYDIISDSQTHRCTSLKCMIVLKSIRFKKTSSGFNVLCCLSPLTIRSHVFFCEGMNTKIIGKEKTKLSPLPLTSFNSESTTEKVATNSAKLTVKL